MISRFFQKKTDRLPSQVQEIPEHLAIIMDGNGRWAKKRGLSRSAGHRAGASKLRDVTAWCGDYGIKYLTVYAFSTENWSRPDEEVHNLMNLLVEFLEKHDKEMEKNGVRLRVSGDLTGIPQDIAEVLDKAVERAKNRDKMQLIIAFNYGGRREIVDAAKSLAQEVLDGRIKVEDIDESSIGENLYLPDVPDPDLIIRPSGEYRLSNFLLWGSAYSELWFSDVLWPDFKQKDLEKVLLDYQKRERRYGAL